MKIELKEILDTFYKDIDHYEKEVSNKKEYLLNLKNKIKDYTKQYYLTKDKELQNEITKNLCRSYDMLHYINAKKNIDRMYLLDREIESLPSVFLIDQKPKLFTINYDLLQNINIENGLSEIEAEELLKWTVNNTRNNLNIECHKRNAKDVYENNSLGGSCGLSQFSSLYPLQKMGFEITINNIGKMNALNHAYGTVIIPINNNGTIIKKRFLIDCTYRQFFTIRYNVVSRFINAYAEIGFFIIQDQSLIEFATKLLKDGYIEATEANLEKYLKPFFSTTKNINEFNQIDKQFSQINILDIIENHQEKFDYSEEEFKRWNMNLDLNTSSKRHL